MAAGDGLIVMQPTSIAYSGTSASINADGGVDFTAVTSLSLNGVFTSAYDNYLIVISGTNAADYQMVYNLRAAGTDATGSNYTQQRLLATSTTVSGTRQSSEAFGRWGYFDSAYMNGYHLHVYGPYLAQPTALRSVSVYRNSGAYIADYASTHSLSTSYDGITLKPEASGTNSTGNVVVFGYEE